MKSDTFVFSCSSCEGTLRTKITNIGKRFCCPKCKNIVLVQQEIEAEDSQQESESSNSQWEHKPVLEKNRVHNPTSIKENFNGVPFLIGMCAFLAVGFIVFKVLNQKVTSTFTEPATSINSKQEPVVSKSQPLIPEQTIPERKPLEMDAKEREYRQAEKSFQEHANIEMEKLRNDPSNIKKDVVGRSKEPTLIKTIYNPTHRASLYSSIGESPIKGTIQIDGLVEGYFGDLNISTQFITFQFLFEFNGDNWKLVSAKRLK